MKQLCLLFFVFAFVTSFAQKKAVLLQNLWNNELTNFTPANFLDKLFVDVRQKLGVGTIIHDSLFFKTPANDSFDSRVANYINARGDSAGTYYIALASDLRLPLINLGRIVFKQPLQRSRFTFILKVYDEHGRSLMDDTLVNKGCVARPVKEDKPANFYSDYKSFTTDMDCHLQAIRQQILSRPLRNAGK